MSAGEGGDAAARAEERGVGIVRRKKLRAGGGTDDGYIGTVHVDVKRYNIFPLLH